MVAGIDKYFEMLVSKCPQCQATRPLPPLAPLLDYIDFDTDVAHRSNHTKIRSALN